MSYQALYRVWRSQRFDTIVGQQMVTQTLKNAIIQNKTSHAYLFTGPRGTGKTSAAKIFAKAINCPNNQEGEPCNDCEICKGITEGRLNDVIEIDAASNNGVEEIRDIREKVKYAPTQAKYKVYIIDEVHMLSTGAFNALLKTLEEPPSNVIFILATTEPHKIPLTIISRTQRFDFKRIDTNDIVAHLAHILNEMKIEFEDQSLYVVARAAEGGMRDALSILDQALSFSDGTLTTDTALKVTGSLTAERLDQLVSACFSKETETGLSLLHALLSEGKESSRMLEDLLVYCRDLLMYQQAPSLLMSQNGTMSEDFKQLSQKMPAETIYQFINVLSETQKEVRFTNHPDIYLEVAIVKLSTLGQVSVSQANSESSVPVSEPTSSPIDNEVVQGLLTRITQLEERFKEVVSSNAGQPVKKEAVKKAPNKSTYRLPTERVYQVLNEATRPQLVQVQEAWEELLQLLTVTQRAMLKASQPVAASPKGLVIAFDYDIVCQRASEDAELHKNTKLGLQRLLQFDPTIVCIPSEKWAGLRNDFINQRPATSTEAHLEPDDSAYVQIEGEPEVEESETIAVTKAQDLFGEEMVEIIED